MKIKFRKVTNIRITHESLGTKPIGRVYEGTVLEVENDMLEGAKYKGNNHWWRDRNGWYYWAGETEALMPENIPDTPIPAPVATVPPQTTPQPPSPGKPPVIATEPVVLPVPEDDLTPAGAVPDGEWRLVKEI